MLSHFLFLLLPLLLLLAQEKTIYSPTGLSPYRTLFPGSSSFYSYVGSLTTPPCDANANWIVFAASVPISSDDLDILRAVLLTVNDTVADSDGSTRRPLVSTNGRQIIYSSNVIISNAASSSNDDDQVRVNLALGIGIAAMCVGLLVLVSLGYLVRVVRLAKYEGTGVGVDRTQRLLSSQSISP
jgi:hypothetical protein